MCQLQSLGMELMLGMEEDRKRVDRKREKRERKPDWEAEKKRRKVE